MQGVLAATRALDDGRHRAEFYRAWRAGYAAAFTHPKSLETMGPRASAATERVRAWLLDGTVRGRGIAELVRTGGARFEEFERALLTLGEESGRFENALRLLGDFYATKHRLMLHVKKLMAYPLITGLAASFIVPLPILVSGHPRAYVASALGSAALLVASAGGLVAGVAAAYGRKPALARARMARALATAVEAGLTLPRAVRLAAEASANPDILAFVFRQEEEHVVAQSIAATLDGCPHVTPDFIGVLRTAEATGDFRVLARLADLYEDGFR